MRTIISQALLHYKIQIGSSDTRGSTERSGVPTLSDSRDTESSIRVDYRLSL